MKKWKAYFFVKGINHYYMTYYHNTLSDLIYDLSNCNFSDKTLNIEYDGNLIGKDIPADDVINFCKRIEKNLAFI